MVTGRLAGRAETQVKRMINWYFPFIIFLCKHVKGLKMNVLLSPCSIVCILLLFSHEYVHLVFKQQMQVMEESWSVPE